MKKNPCNCPAYPFPHRQGGGKCNLPSTCDFMSDLMCLDWEEGECEYVDDCPLVRWIADNQQVEAAYDTLQEKYL